MDSFRQIFKRSLLQMVRRPIYWVALFVLPLFVMLMLTSMMENGLPQKVPAGIVDKDGSSISRQITQNLGSMQMVDLTETADSYTEARHLMQEGDIFRLASPSTNNTVGASGHDASRDG